MELKLKTPWRDGTTHLMVSPLKFMQLPIEGPACSDQMHSFYVCSGSGHACRLPRFIAEKQPLKLRFPVAADRQ
jgi:hypothetical protein